MTEEEGRALPGDEGTGDNTGAQAAPSKAAPEKIPDISAENDPIIGDAEEVNESFLSKLNPLRLFRGQSADNFVREGREHLENGSLAQATVSFKKALNADPNNSHAYRGLGKVFFKKGGSKF